MPAVMPLGFSDRKKDQRLLSFLNGLSRTGYPTIFAGYAIEVLDEQLILQRVVFNELDGFCCCSGIKVHCREQTETDLL